MVESKNYFQHQYITVNGIKLHYVKKGEGSLILFLHGFPEFWYSWRHQILEFSQDYQAIALDLRGYNDSEKPVAKEAYTITELIKDIEGVIKGNGYDRCILVGHDWGGMLAWHFAYAYPQMVEKLIVLNLPHPAKFTQGLRTNLRQMLRSWYVLLFQLPFLPEFLCRVNNYRSISSLFTELAVDQTAFSPEDIKAYKEAAAKPGALTAMLNYYRSNFKLIFKQKKWEILHVPTLMIWGENDIALGKELTYGTQEYVKNFQIRYIPECSHWVQQEQPELVNRYIRDFLEQ
ncbi:MAG: alpha/beta fold hydrolase [Xenococcaceae cyanobacterium]